jgi:hypothetical protein
MHHFRLAESGVCFPLVIVTMLTVSTAWSAASTVGAIVVSGSALLAVGEIVSVLTPGAATSTGGRVAVQLRDFGFTLGPAVIGAIALSSAAAEIHAKIAASATLQKALAAFNQAPAHVPAAQRASVSAAVHAVNSGPLGANAVPATVPGPGGKPVPLNPLKDVAFHALGHAYSTGYHLRRSRAPGGPARGDRAARPRPRTAGYRGVPGGVTGPG